MEKESQIVSQPTDRIEEGTSHNCMEPIPSELTDSYFQLLDHEEIQQGTIQGLAKQLFQRQRIRYFPHQFNSQLRLEIFAHSPQFKIITLKASIGPFSMLLKIINQDIQSPSHHLANISHSHTSIFFPPDKLKQTIKCFSFADCDIHSKIFSKVIKEYCLLKIASGLGVGPKCNPDSGFDLIVFENCVEFSMQRCLQPENIPEGQQEGELGKLKKKLSLLHYFNMVHLDIKPMNIMLSPSINELVFIDFGFSCILQEKIRFKSLSTFAGTLNYCSHEMQRLISSTVEQSYIDLYYNDAHCLELSLQQLRLKMERHNSLPYEEDSRAMSDMEEMILNKQSTGKTYYDFWVIMKIKRAIYEKNRSLLLNRSFKSILAKYAHQFLYILQEYRFCGFLRKSQEKQRVNLQSKKQKIFTSQQAPKIDENSLQQKLQFITGLDSSTVIFNSDSTIKKRLFSVETVNGFNKTEYFRHFVKIVDLRQASSTFQEKESMSRILLQFCKVDPNGFQTNSQFHVFEVSLRYILSLYLQNPDNYFEEVIPTALINLVILQALTLSQFLELMNQSINLALMGQCFRLCVMLFRLHFVFDWIQFKAVSVYNQVKLDKVVIFPIFFRLDQLLKGNREESVGLLVLILIKLISRELGFMEIREEDCDDIITQINSLKELQANMVEELTILTIFLKENSKHFIGLEYILITFVDIYQHSPEFLEDCSRITSVHLRIYDFLQKISKTTIGLQLKIFKGFSNCLQDFDLITKFKMFYAFDPIQTHNEARVLERVNLLVGLCKEESYRYSNEIVNLLYIMVKQTRDNKIKDLIIPEIRTVFDLDYLKRIQFPKNEFLSNHTSFYYRAGTTIHFFFYLYAVSSPQIDQVHQFLEQLAHFHQNIKCKECKQICYFSLLDSQKHVFLMSNRISDALVLLMNELEDGGSMASRRKDNRGFLALVFRSLAIILWQIRVRKSTIHSDFDTFLYQSIKSHQMFHIMFIIPNGIDIYNFLHHHIMESQGKVKEYLNLQAQLLDFIECYPSNEFVTAYNKCLSSWNQPNNPQAQIVLRTYLEQFKPKLNSYGCLLLVITLRSAIGLHSSLTLKIASCICLKTLSVTILARVLSLQQLFSFIFCSGTLWVRSRQKRRKTIKYAHYLRLRFDFSTLMRSLSIKQRRSQSLFSSCIMKNMRRFYNNLQDPSIN